MRKLPPLNSLKVFESVVRTKSFTKTAEELCVSQGAISKQIKILEEYLGIHLFERKHQHISLTEKAELYRQPIQSALEMIEQATEELMQAPNPNEVLRINILPSLSSAWLIPKLKDFKELYPHITVNIDVGDGKVDFNLKGTDIAIRTTDHSECPQIYSQIFMEEELIPVCSAKLDISSPNDLAHHPLLQHTTRPEMWNDYLHSIGSSHIEVVHTLGFEHFFMLIRAAIDGLGVALIPRILIEEELQIGSLKLAFDIEYNSPFDYYFLCQKNKKGLAKVTQFRDWLISASPSLPPTIRT